MLESKACNGFKHVLSQYSLLSTGCVGHCGPFTGCKGMKHASVQENQRAEDIRVQNSSTIALIWIGAQIPCMALLIVAIVPRAGCTQKYARLPIYFI